MIEGGAGSTGPIHYLNLEYFFRLIYEAFFGGAGSGGGGPNTFITLLSNIWFTYTIIAYLVSLAALFVLIYMTIRLKQIRDAEEEQYSTIEPKTAIASVEHSRWNHVITLIEGTRESDWRQAIIEADIMLDDALSGAGYQGQGVGEKLKQADPARFRTLQDAWEAHKVRNEIAHQGSQYQLTDHIAYRTIKRYENVFTEFGLI